MSEPIYGPGFQGFVCELSGEHVAASECLACASAGAPGCRYGSPAIIAGIANNMRTPNFSLAAAQQKRTDVHFDFGFSATELLGCPRKKRLTQEYPWWDKPSSLYWAFRGNLMHAQAEAYGEINPYAVVEERLFWFLRFSGKVIGLSGAPDLLVYQPQQEGWLMVDYKTMKKVQPHLYRHICQATGKIISDMPFRVRGKQMNCPHCEMKHPKDEIQIIQVDFQPRGSHREQLQIYALLVEKNAAKLAATANARLLAAGLPASVPPDAPVTGAELVYMDMAGMIRTEVEIWSYDDRLAFLKEKLAAAITPEMPLALTDSSQTWQCNYCPVATTCEGYGKIEAFDEAQVIADLGYAPTPALAGA